MAWQYLKKSSIIVKLIVTLWRINVKKGCHNRVCSVSAAADSSSAVLINIRQFAVPVVKVALNVWSVAIVMNSSAL